MTYFPEDFTAEEADILSRYFTNLDRPVYGVTNLPQVVISALFSRFVRSNKSLRRLFLDEFVADLVDLGLEAEPGHLDIDRTRALYERSFTEFGHESVAQLGGVHIACEQSSNLLTKILERGRLATYAEQSTRGTAYDSRLRGRYRYLRDPEILGSKLGAAYVGGMDSLFDEYSELLRPMIEHFRRVDGRSGVQSNINSRRATRERAFDSVRGILPAGALSNVGIFATPHAYARLLIRLLSHPLPEARECGAMMAEELDKLIPNLLGHTGHDLIDIDVANWQLERSAATAEVVRELIDAEPAQSADGPSVRLIDWDPEGELKVIAAMCFAQTDLGDDALLERIRSMSEAELDRIVAAYAGQRPSRAARPGRALERSSYRFEIVSDYGAFRDLQRHRMLTIEWQRLTPQYGYRIPETISEAGFESRFSTAMETSAALYYRLEPAFTERASYAVSLAYNLRYVMELNARSAMHVIELRSGRAGHPSYRPIVQQMHSLIDTVAGHHRIAKLMAHVDLSQPGPTGESSASD
jgi:thymidylate synthase ThyX